MRPSMALTGVGRATVAIRSSALAGDADRPVRKRSANPAAIDRRITSNNTLDVRSLRHPHRITGVGGITPNVEQFQQLAAAPDTGPVVMINLLKFRSGGADGPGVEQYRRYG